MFITFDNSFKELIWVIDCYKLVIWNWNTTKLDSNYWQGKIGLAGCIHVLSTQRPSNDQLAWLHLRPCLVSSWCGAILYKYLRLLKTVRCFVSSQVWCHGDPPKRKSGCEINCAFYVFSWLNFCMFSYFVLLA